MRLAGLLVLATACGRFGFGDIADDPIDGAVDGTIDVARDPWVARYPMDDDPATGMITAIPASYSVPCSPCPTAIAGRLDGGYAFDGTVRIPLGHPALLGTAAFSVTLWLRPPVSTDPLQSIVSKPNPLPSVLNVYSLTLFADIGDVSWESSEADSIRSISAGRDLRGGWHHITTTWDGSTRSLFIDGTFVASDAIVFADSTLDVSLGADVDNGTPLLFFTGELDDLRFYDRALDTAEIAALANP